MVVIRLLKLCLLLALLGEAALAQAETGVNELRLATTTSVKSAGLLEQLVQEFSKDTGITLAVSVVGSGHALRMARKGQVDAVLVHSPRAERKFLEDGYGIDRRPVMQNDFVLVGPVTDPAAIQGMSAPTLALKKISGSASNFVSRGDDSGTHNKELELWRGAGIDPFGKGWYFEVGLGMAGALQQAYAEQAYALIDSATFLVNSDAKFAVMVKGHPSLTNIYVVIRTNPERVENIRSSLAKTFADWLTGLKGQSMIQRYRRGGKTLYTPAKPVQ